MRVLHLPWLCLLALVAWVPLAHAQIYHCIGAHGEPVFSGQPCGVPATTFGKNAMVPGQSLAEVCAGSPQELRQSIVRSFATHDVNRLAGLILWRDMDQASAQATLRSLAVWLKQPLVGIAIAYAAGPPYADAGPAPVATIAVPGGVPQLPTGFEVSTGGPDGSTRDFGIIEFGGCWWLTF